MKTALTIAATIALAIATDQLVAQTTGAPASTAPSATPTTPHPATTPPSGMPPTPTPPSAVPTSPQSNLAPQMGRAGMPTTMPPGFGTLDTRGIGYVTQQEASSNPWLSKNFTMCDANHDGQVSRGEYATCSQHP